MMHKGDRKLPHLQSNLHWKGTRLDVKLVVLILVCIFIPLAMIYFITQGEVKGILSDKITKINQSAANTVNAEVSEFVTAAEEVTTQLAQSNTASLFLVGVAVTMDSDLEKFIENNPWALRVEFATENGTSKVYPNESGEDAGDLKASLWYERAKTDNQLVWIPAMNKSDQFRLAIPLRYSYNDQIAGVLSVVVDMQHFVKILQTQSIANGTILLINETGAVLASDQETEVDLEMFEEQPFFKKGFESEEVVAGTYSFARESRLTFVKQIPQLDSIVLVQVPNRLAYGEVDGLLSKLRWIVVITLLLVLGVTIAMSRYMITKQIKALVRSAGSIAEGNLTETIELQSRDEIGTLANAFNQMTANLRTVITDIHENAGKVAEASAQIRESTEVSSRVAEQVARSIEQVAAGADDQSHLIEGVNGKLAELSQSVNGLETTSRNVESIAIQTRAKADQGVQSMQRVVEQMSMIQKSIFESVQTMVNMVQATDEISTFVNIIDNIANQTNLLALNAAIEAARAGEEGRGFAVVAAEIRSLAEEVSVSAGKIRHLVDRTHGYSEEVSHSMEEGARQITTGQQVVGESQSIFTDIFTSFEETLISVQRVNEMIHDVSQNTGEIVASAEKIAGIAGENASAAEEVAASTEEQAAAVSEVYQLAETLTELSKALDGMVQKFTV